MMLVVTHTNTTKIVFCILFAMPSIQIVVYLCSFVLKFLRGIQPFLYTRLANYQLSNIDLGITVTLLFKKIYLGVFDNMSHNILPVSVNCLKQSSFFWHLSHDIFRGEDRLQIQPLCLHLQPFINSVLYTEQPLFPFLYNINTFLDINGQKHYDWPITTACNPQDNSFPIKHNGANFM